MPVAPTTRRVRDWPVEVPMAEDSLVAGVAMIDQVRVIDWRARNPKQAGRRAGWLLEEARAKLGAQMVRPIDRKARVDGAPVRTK